MHNAGPEYATETRKERYDRAYWDKWYAPEYHNLCAIKVLLEKHSYTTLSAADMLSDVEYAIQELLEIEI